MKKHLTIILANALIENGNKGCVALTYSCLSILDKIFTEANIDYTIYLPDSRCKGKTGESRVLSLGGKEIEYHIVHYYKSIHRKENAILGVKQILGTSKDKSIFKNADFLFDIGQGDSFADIYGARRFASIDLIHVISRELKKPMCILPQTIGPFKDSAIRKKAVLSLEKADLVMARDTQSQTCVKELLPSKNVKEYIDTAFVLPYNKVNFDKEYVHVGINISSLLWNGGYTKDNQFGLICDYHSVIYSLLDYFLEKPNVKVHLVGHVVVGFQHVENDYAVNTDIWKKYNHQNLVLAPLFMDPIVAKSYISGMDFFMGARMHSTIAAFSSGVSVVPMAYSRKYNGLFEDTLNYHYMTDLIVQTQEEVLATIKDAFERRNELKEIIINRMNTIVKEREQLMYDELRKFFKIAPNDK